jgi:hypothetical protein
MSNHKTCENCGNTILCMGVCERCGERDWSGSMTLDDGSVMRYTGIEINLTPDQELTTREYREMTVENIQDAYEQITKSWNGDDIQWILMDEKITKDSNDYDIQWPADIHWPKSCPPPGEGSIYTTADKVSYIYKNGQWEGVPAVRAAKNEAVKCNTIEDTKKALGALKCECGATKCGLTTHSEWCALYKRG